MKLRTACTTFAIALAACAVSPSVSSADELAPTQVRKLTIAEQVDQLRIYVIEGTFNCVELSEKIDFLVKRIDTLLDNGAENHVELIKQRKIALDLKAQLKCDQNEDGLAADENGTTLAGSSSCNGGGGCPPAGGGGGGILRTGTRGGGGGVAGGAGGIGTLLGVGGVAAAIAIPVAVSNGGGGGRPASPSEIEPEPEPEPGPIVL